MSDLMSSNLETATEKDEVCARVIFCRAGLTFLRRGHLVNVGLVGRVRNLSFTRGSSRKC